MTCPKKHKRIFVNTGERVIALGGSVYPPLTEMERVRVALAVEKLLGPSVDPIFLKDHSIRPIFKPVE